jgi:HD-like signal output (HDOD) protein
MDFHKLVKDVTSLISLPDIYFKVSRLLEDPSCTSQKLAKVISYDPGLTVRLLKIANSAYYGQEQQVETINRAVTLIGHGNLLNLVLATTIGKALDHITLAMNMKAFWQHNVCCALAARALAAPGSSEHRERIFIAGLLHDVGVLLINYQLPDIAQKIQSQLITQGGERYLLEEEQLGFTHADIGADLLREWQLPASLCEAVEYHHEPSKALQYPIDAACVHIGNVLVNCMDLQAQTIDCVQVKDKVYTPAWSICGHNEEVIESISIEVCSQWSEIFQVINP